jgi:Uma2 family endonuclease
MIEQGAFDHVLGKIELIRGELREMNPAGPTHDDLVAYLNDWSVRATDPKAIRVRVQSGLELSDQQSRPEPDLLWVRARRYAQQHPTAADVTLVIEVSDCSLEADYSEKAALYAAAEIPEYWVVDATQRCIHVFRHPQAGEYQTCTAVKLGDRLLPLAPCHHPLSLDDLFV